MVKCLESVLEQNLIKILISIKKKPHFIPFQEFGWQKERTGEG